MIRILIVDDFEPWRRKVCELLQWRPDLQIICEVSDGAAAVQKACELKPDLILLDIGLPKLNGIEAARQIHKLVPQSKILALSQEIDSDVAHELLSVGVLGYVAKVRAESDLRAAVEAVLLGEQFVSSDSKDREPSREGVNKKPSFDLDFEPESKVFHLRFHGSITNESIKDFYQTAASRVSGYDFRASIVDFSDVKSLKVTMNVIRELAASPPIDPEISHPRVVVAPNILIYGLALIFQVIGKGSRPKLHVVRQLPQAFALLGLDRPHFQPFEPRIPI
jgi:DNA-binding NarL/FixJ family response regulator